MSFFTLTFTLYLVPTGERLQVLHQVSPEGSAKHLHVEVSILKKHPI